MATFLVLSALLGALQPALAEVRCRMESACASSLLGVASNVVNSVIGGGSAEGLVFLPYRGELSASIDEVIVEVGDAKASTRFPVNLTPCSASCFGLVRVRAHWDGELVALRVGSG